MQEFADRAGLSKGYISMLESGKHPKSQRPLRPSLPTYQKIASAMNMRLDDLLKKLDGEEPVSLGSKTTQFSEEDAELLAYLDMLRTRPECRVLLDTLKGATKEEVEANVRFIEALRREEK